MPHDDRFNDISEITINCWNLYHLLCAAHDAIAEMHGLQIGRDSNLERVEALVSIARDLAEQTTEINVL